LKTNTGHEVALLLLIKFTRRFTLLRLRTHDRGIEFDCRLGHEPNLILEHISDITDLLNETGVQKVRFVQTA
jgi:hypothetical protein